MVRERFMMPPERLKCIAHVVMRRREIRVQRHCLGIADDRLLLAAELEQRDAEMNESVRSRASNRQRGAKTIDCFRMATQPLKSDAQVVLGVRVLWIDRGRPRENLGGFLEPSTLRQKTAEQAERREMRRLQP